ncbi:MAG: type II secretion system minor pseudopilin GspI [Burkholderiales bacterium]|nr:type II secretion system minor pseudopilin GspI [Burkholderiales bacterium]
MNKGFTLFETLIALAIVAIALIAAMRAAASASGSAYELRQRLLADWVAQNRMAELTARQEWPNFGTVDGQETQAGIAFSWSEQISSTPNPLFRKILIQVYADADKQHALRQLTGYLVRPMP